MFQLGKLGHSLLTVLKLPRDNFERLTLSVDNLLVAHGNELVLLAWDVDHRGELAVSFLRLDFTVSLAYLLAIVQVVEVDIAILAARDEAHIICEPIDAHDSANVAAKLHPLSALVRVKVVYVDAFFIGNRSEEMASIGEADLVTALD